MMKMNKQKKWWSVLGIIAGCSLLVLGYTALADGEVTIKLRIEGSNETVFSDTVEVGDCEVTDAGGEVHNLTGMAVCALTNALNEVGIDAVFKDFGFGLFLDAIGEDVTPSDWSYSWSFWVNGQPASVGVDSYPVEAGDELLLAFSVYPTVPLIVNLSDVMIVGDPFDIEVSEIVGDYDGSFVWHGSLEPAEGVSLWVDDALFSVGETGVVEVLINEASEIQVWAESVGKVRSERQVVQVLVVPEPTSSPSISPSVSPTISPSVIPPPSVSPTISPSVSPSPIVVREVMQEEREQAARRALGYLRDNQDSDGTIGGTVVSGWSAMAFGANGERASDVKQGGVTLWDGLSLASLDKATDVERQIMAVRAAGGNPRDWQTRNLVQDLRSYYKQGQFGEETLINDDIFGVLALLAADESVTTLELRQGVSNIILWQEDNGSWVNVDLTAAAIQALREYEARGGDINVTQAVEGARDYLRDEQDDDGGWAYNSASTAWVIQAIFVLGEDPNNWSNKDGKTPWNSILGYQKDNGGISWKLTDNESTFMTAYVVPALLGVSWPIQVLGVDNNLVEAGQQPKEASLSQSFVTVRNSVQPSVIPMVAGASTTIEASSSNNEANTGANTVNEVTKDGGEVLSNEIISETKRINIIDPRKSDFRFAFSLFGLVNMGVGVTVARLVMRI